MGDIEVFLVLLALVAALSAVARWLQLQRPILLVLAGITAGLIPGLPRIDLDPHVVLVLFLPPLLYYAALNTSLGDFRANIRPITLLSVGLVLVTTVVIGLVAAALVPGLPLPAAFALGAIVAPPDAVAAVAVGRSVGLPRHPLAILEGESLVNDATALVAYRIAVAAVGAASVTVWDAVGQFVAATVVGVAWGLGLSVVIAAVRRRLDDPSVENSLSLLTPFAAYLPSEALDGSGVLAVVVAGLYLGRHSPVLLSSATRLEVHAMWRMITYLLEGVIFALIGLQLPSILGGVRGHGPITLATYAVAVVAAVVAVRFAWVFLTMYLPGGLGLGGGIHSWRLAVAFSWAGMRGVVSLAAALALPQALADGTPFPERDLLLFLTAAVIVATLVLQGMTLPLVIRRLGLADRVDREEQLQREEAVADHHIARRALALLEQLAADQDLPEEVVDDQRHHLEDRIRAAHAALGGCPGEDEYHHPNVERESGRSTTREIVAISQSVRNALIEAERAELLRLRNAGDISDDVQRDLERMLDLEQVALPGA